MEKKLILVLKAFLVLLTIFNITRIDYTDIDSVDNQNVYVNLLSNFMLMISMTILCFQNSQKA